MVDDIIKFLEDNSLSFKRYKEGDSHIQLNCPLCTDKRGRLGIKILKSSNKNEDYYWKCFNCNAHSRSLKFLRKSINSIRKNGKLEAVEHKKVVKKLNNNLSDLTYEALKKPENKDVVKYIIQERGLSKEAIKHFKLGVRSKFKNKEGETYKTDKHLSIPYFDGEDLVNIKYRNLNPDRKGGKWRREAGGETILFNKNVLYDHQYDEIYIAEAEIDAMTLWSHGIKNVVGLSAGANGFQQEWRELLLRFNKIYLVLDTDEAGQAGAYDIAKMLGLDKCINVVLPDDIKDINEYFKNHSTDEFNRIVNSSTQFSVPDVVDLRSLLKNALIELKVGKRIEKGLDTEWEKVNNIIGPLLPGNLIVWAARPKCGKCLGKSTIVVNPENMMPVTIEDAIRNNQKLIHSYNEETKKIEVCEISDWIDSGIKPMVKVSTKLGREVETTYSHRYLTFNGWKYVSELKVGDRIAVPTKFEFFGDTEWPIEKVHFLAGLIADGGLNGTTPDYTKTDKDLISIMNNASNRLFQTPMKLKDKITYSFTDGNKGTKNNVMQFCKDMKIDCLSKNKAIPNEVFSLKKDLIKEFVGMLWSHDGAIVEKNNKHGVQYSSASEKLIDGLNHLLIRFGINLKKRYKKVKLNNDFFDAWILESYQKDTVKRFLEVFPIYGEKSNIKVIISNKMDRDYITNYPKEIWNIIDKEIRNSNISELELRKLVLGQWYYENGKIRGTAKFKKKGNCSREMLIKINTYLKSSLLQSLIDSDISFVEITEIKDIGEHQCYDLTVPKNENFIANDIVCHNTTMVMQWLFYLAKHHNICTFNYQCEMEEEDMLEKYTRSNYPSAYVKLPPVKFDEDGQIIFNNHSEQKEYNERKQQVEDILRWSANNLPVDLLKSYHPKSQFDINIDKACDKIRQTVQRFNCKVVVFDNLHFLCRGRDSTQKIEEATQKFKMLARELGVVLVLVTHPRKTNHNKELDNDDLKDSGAIFQDADVVVLMHREASKEKADANDEDEDNVVLENATLIKVTARRHQGGRAIIAFDPNNIKFVESGDAFDRAMKK